MEHYDALLAEHYDWMFGATFESKVAEQKELLRELAGADGNGRLAVDLGCGSGFQSIALSELGYRVLSLDSSERLLQELSSRADQTSVTVRHADIRELEQHVDAQSARLVVCMGDTLTHLGSMEEICTLLRAIWRVLKPGGTLVLTYRDLAAGELSGLERFIPVRADDSRIMTCFLEYLDEQTVRVNDLIYVRDGRNWSLRKSSYRKLRLPLAWLCAQVEAAGLLVTRQQPGRLATLVATRPP
jgi:ubiquinone/menaquinone biosynthesis C-methylase UbiE